MMRHEDFEIVGLLYDAALGSVDQCDISRRLVDLVDGETLSFTAQHGAEAAIDIVDMRGVTAKEVELYAEHYKQHDLWITAALKRRIVDRAILGTEIVSNLEWQNSQIYTELCRPNTDIFHGVMIISTLPNGGSFALGIHRPRRANPFKPELAERLTGLLPHLKKSLQVRGRLGAAAAQLRISSALADNLSFGVVQLNFAGQVIAANKAAMRILAENDGISLANSGLRAAANGDDARLCAAISHATKNLAAIEAWENSDGCLYLTRPSGLRPYSVIVVPMGLNRAAPSLGQPAAMLIITDPEARPLLNERAVRTLFGLTKAEARIVSLLVTGLGLPEIAKRTGISFETARTHLAHARAKTGTVSQIDLVRTVLVALSPIDQSFGKGKQGA